MFGKMGRTLEQQTRFTDTRLATNQHEAAWYQSATEYARKFLIDHRQTRHATARDGVQGQRGTGTADYYRTPIAGRCLAAFDLFDQCAPTTTVGAPTHFACLVCPALLTNKYGACFGHELCQCIDDDVVIVECHRSFGTLGTQAQVLFTVFEGGHINGNRIARHKPPIQHPFG